MYDMAVPNETPGVCAKCRGKRVYRWGPVVNGKSAHEGKCYSCAGTGRQTHRDINRNNYYNSKKIIHL